MLRGGCLFLIVALSTTPGAKTAAMIPSLAGETLAGKHIRLPADIGQRIAILIVGFTQQSAEQAAQWGVEAGKLHACGSEQTAEWYQMPVLSGVPRLIRPLVVRAIRSELGPELRAHFLPIYSDEASWKEALSFSVHDDAYIAIVRRDGTLKFSTHGAVDPRKLSQLSDQLHAACLE